MKGQLDLSRSATALVELALGVVSIAAALILPYYLMIILYGGSAMAQRHRKVCPVTSALLTQWLDASSGTTSWTHRPRAIRFRVFLPIRRYQRPCVMSCNPPCRRTFFPVPAGLGPCLTGYLPHHQVPCASRQLLQVGSVSLAAVAICTRTITSYHWKKPPLLFMLRPSARSGAIDPPRAPRPVAALFTSRPILPFIAQFMHSEDRS